MARPSVVSVAGRESHAALRVFMIAIVKSYDPRRGAGELSPEGGGAAIAVFVGEVERAGLATLTTGQRLSYSVQTDRIRKRSFAVGLVLL